MKSLDQQWRGNQDQPEQASELKNQTVVEDMSFPLFVLFCHKEKRVGSCTICGFHITLKRVYFNFANFASKTIRKIKMLAGNFYHTFKQTLMTLKKLRNFNAI